MIRNMSHRIPLLLSSPTFHRFIRFGLVGGSGVVVDMGMLFLLADPRTLGWGLSLSKTLAAETAIVNNFIWNDVWTSRTFRPSKSAGAPGRGDLPSST
jgi:dolichol-phosphate mannosyltransferase